ncbi:MAG TPA: DUF4435 domain-containing protein [Desulfobacterales bacterium]|nr:DUF4435 domain-containing protein [Desulfobacterales bacterium]
MGGTEMINNKASALNAWIMVIREKERQKCVSDREKLNLNNIKFDDLFSVEVDRVTSSYNTDSLNSRFDGNDITENEIRERENTFSGKDRGCLFRGKYEIAFLTKFLRKIQDDLCCRSPKSFPEKRKVSFNFTDGNILSELSRFADTPQCLRDYLKDIKDKYYAQSDC